MKFFLSWNMWSVLFLWMLFESTVPLLEVLPEENFAMIVLMSVSVLCFYKVKERAPLNFVNANGRNNRRNSASTALIIDAGDGEEKTMLNMDDVLQKERRDTNNAVGNQTTDADAETTDDADETDAEMDVDLGNPAVCSVCRRYAAPRSFHCYVCDTCVVRQDHHNVWLNCCVGQNGYRLYFMGCIFGVCALLLGANLAMTSICHPFLVWNVLGVYVLLPDDCSEVYEQYE